MSYLDPILAAAPKEPWGGQRFYPPGEHPATYRLRQEREALLGLPPARDRNAALAYVEQTLAAFEEEESISKADYLRRIA